MTSQLNVDTIVDKAGSGGTNVKIGNTSTYVSDGGATTQNTVQGLTKAWINFNGTGTIATADSFNRSGLTDNGTGDYTLSFTNNMANTTYCFTGGLGSTSDRAILILNNGVNLSASAFTFQTIYDGDTKIDSTVVTVQITGDLA